MKKVQFSYVFGRKSKDGKGLIELRAYLEGKQKYFSSKIYVHSYEWNKNKQQIVRHPNKENLNDQLDAIIERLEKEQRRAIDYAQDFDLEIVKGMMNKVKSKTNCFTEFAFSEIKMDNGLAIGTKHAKNNTLKQLIEYNEGKPVQFDQINYSFCHEFVNHLKGKGYDLNTVHKHHKNFKAMLTMAINKGFFDKKNPLKDFKVSVPAKKIDALTKVQMIAIENLHFEEYEMKLDLFRDMFLFSCYTGLRVSDIVSLEWGHIKTKDDGIYLEKRAVKTKKNVVLPLSKLFPNAIENTTKPLNILKKYSSKETGLIFKKYSEQVYNRGLKDIAYKASITDFVLTAHIGRKTFATFIGNHTALSTWELQYLLQHSNIKTTEKYVFTDQKRVNESLDKTDWFV